MSERLSSYEQRRSARRAQTRASSERQTPREPRPGPSVYEGHYAHATAAREPVTVATTNPATGELEWVPDWPRLATGWKPLHEFLWERGIW